MSHRIVENQIQKVNKVFEGAILPKGPKAGLKETMTFQDVKISLGLQFSTGKKQADKIVLLPRR